MQGKSIFIILFSLVIVLVSSVFLVGVYYFDWFKSQNPNNYAVFIQKSTDRVQKDGIDLSDVTSDIIIKKTIEEKKTFGDTDVKKIDNKSNLHKEKLSKTNNLTDKLKNNLIDKNSVIFRDISSDTHFGKGSNLTAQEFHSLGELVSAEEYNYRLSLIKNLKLKTVIIDSITKGNGVTQEYYKIVFKTDMIPAKVMDNVINTKEFRELIPNKYLVKEVEVNGLRKGEKIVFKNSDIKEILLKWSLGRLTPIEKAWESKAL